MSEERRGSEGREGEEGSSFGRRRFQKAPAALTKAGGRRMGPNGSHRAAVTGPGAVHSPDMKRGPFNEGEGGVLLKEMDTAAARGSWRGGAGCSPWPGQRHGLTRQALPTPQPQGDAKGHGHGRLQNKPFPPFST